MKSIINLEIKVVSEANVRCHWAERAKRVKQQRETAFWATQARRMELGYYNDKILTITLTRKSKRFLDDDNLSGAFKAIRDGIADALWPNLPAYTRDNHSRCIWIYTQEKSDSPGIRITIDIED